MMVLVAQNRWIRHRLQKRTEVLVVSRCRRSPHPWRHMAPLAGDFAADDAHLARRSQRQLSEVAGSNQLLDVLYVLGFQGVERRNQFVSVQVSEA